MKRNTVVLRPVVALAVAALAAGCGGDTAGPAGTRKPAEPAHVDLLFIGNSLSLYSDVPGKLQSLIDSAGADITISDASFPASPLAVHLQRGITLDSIRLGKWECMILQDANYTIAFPDYHSYLDSIYDALRDTIFTYNRGCDLVYFMDFPMRDGVTIGGTFYDFAEFAAMIRLGTLIMADRMDFMIAPIGVCFNAVHAERPDIELFHPDGSHPSNEGSYLQACVYFSVLTRAPSAGLPFHGGVDSADAVYLQEIASTAVLDSLAQWNIGP